MSDLEPRGGGRLSRKERADRAYTLVLATGGLAVATVVLVVLAVVGIAGFGWAVTLALLTALSGFLLRRTLNP
jgi:fatty acid desaturase